MRASITAAESAQKGLREALEKLDDLKHKNGVKLTTNEALLRAFKASFQAAGRKWPRLVADRAYDEAAFIKEVDRLLEERNRLEGVANEVAVAADTAYGNERSLAMQVQVDRAILETLEASKPLLAKPLSSTIERILAHAHERLSDSELEKPEDPASVRTVFEPMQAASRKSRLTAAEFLNSKPESRK